MSCALGSSFHSLLKKKKEREKKPMPNAHEGGCPDVMMRTFVHYTQSFVCRLLSSFHSTTMPGALTTITALSGHKMPASFILLLLLVLENILSFAQGHLAICCSQGIRASSSPFFPLIFPNLFLPTHFLFPFPLSGAGPGDSLLASSNGGGEKMPVAQRNPRPTVEQQQEASP